MISYKQQKMIWTFCFQTEDKNDGCHETIEFCIQKILFPCSLIVNISINNLFHIIPDRLFYQMFPLDWSFIYMLQSCTNSNYILLNQICKNVGKIFKIQIENKYYNKDEDRKVLGDILTDPPLISSFLPQSSSLLVKRRSRQRQFIF